MKVEVLLPPILPRVCSLGWNNLAHQQAALTAGLVRAEFNPKGVLISRWLPAYHRAYHESVATAIHYHLQHPRSMCTDDARTANDSSSRSLSNNRTPIQAEVLFPLILPRISSPGWGCNSKRIGWGVRVTGKKWTSSRETQFPVNADG